MKKFLPLLLVVAVGAITGLAQQKTTGNGAPSGPHYDLNIIGVSKGKLPPLTGSDRHTIFVPLYTNGKNSPDSDPVPGTDIFLTQGLFTVCDGNGFDAAYDCSGNKVANLGAVFQLPCNTDVTTATGTTLIPCSTLTGEVASYTVWGRVVGTPGGSGSITTCATDTSTGTLVCSVSSNVAVFVRKNGKPVFSTVTNQLTSIVTPAGTCTTSTITGGTCTVSLFGAGFQNFFWDYDNNGNRVLQLRFYLQ